MDRNFELGADRLREAMKASVPLIKDWRGFQPEFRVVDELLLGVAHAISNGAGSAEDRVKVAAESLRDHLPGWIRQKGDEENTVEIRRELSKITPEALHSRAVSCAQLCSDELMSMTYDARHQTAQQLASAWGWVSRVTGRVLERSHRGEN